MVSRLERFEPTVHQSTYSGSNNSTWSHKVQRMMPSVTSVLLVSPADGAWATGTSCIELADVTDRRVSVHPLSPPKHSSSLCYAYSALSYAYEQQ